MKMCVTNARCWIIELDGRVYVTYRVCQERETIGRICGLNKVTALFIFVSALGGGFSRKTLSF
jgi:hypothetical protein